MKEKTCLRRDTQRRGACFRRRRRRRFIRRGLETTKKLSPIGREERFAPFGIFFDALNVAATKAAFGVDEGRGRLSNL